MVLKTQGLQRRVRGVYGGSVVIRVAKNLDVVLDQRSVVQNRNACALDGLPLLVESRRPEKDVVSLPLAGRARCVHQWSVLFVDRSGLPMEVGFVAVRVEYLDLVVTHEENAAIPALLSFAFDGCRGCPLDVELTVAERLRGKDVARPWRYFYVTISHLPLRRASITAAPTGEALSIE